MPPMFQEAFQSFPSMFEGTLNGAMMDNFPQVSQHSSKPSSEAGERIIPIQVVNNDMNQVGSCQSTELAWIINSRIASVRVEITSLEMFQLRSV